MNTVSGISALKKALPTFPSGWAVFLSKTEHDYVLRFSILYGALTAIIAPRMTHTVGVDSFAYIRSAEHYLDGRFDLAVTAYWAPLLSWLSLPVLAITDDYIVLTHAMSFVSCVIFLLGSLRFAAAFGMNHGQLPLFVFLCGLFGYMNTFTDMRPDLLFAGLILLAAGTLHRAALNTTADGMGMAGVWFGLAFLAKSAGLFIGIGLILGLSVFQRLHGRGFPRGLPRCLAAFFAVAGVWIAILSAHEGEFTTSNSGKINLALRAPDAPWVNGFHPQFLDFNAPQEGRIARWEAPQQEDYIDWSPTQSIEDFRFFLSMVPSNTRRILHHLAHFDIFDLGLFAIVAAMTLTLWLLLRRKPVPPWAWAAFLVPLLCWPYALTHAWQNRYFFACFPIALMMALCFATMFRLPWQRLCGLSLVGISFGAYAVGMLIIRAAPGDDSAFEMAKQLRGQIAPAQSIASVADRKVTALYFAWLTDTPYHGDHPGPDISLDDLLDSGAELFIISTHPLKKNIPQKGHPDVIANDWKKRRDITDLIKALETSRDFEPVKAQSLDRYRLFRRISAAG